MTERESKQFNRTNIILGFLVVTYIGLLVVFLTEAGFALINFVFMSVAMSPIVLALIARNWRSSESENRRRHARVLRITAIVLGVPVVLLLLIYLFLALILGGPHL